WAWFPSRRRRLSRSRSRLELHYTLELERSAGDRHRGEEAVRSGFLPLKIINPSAARPDGFKTGCGAIGKAPFDGGPSRVDGGGQGGQIAEPAWTAGIITGLRVAAFGGNARSGEGGFGDPAERLFAIEQPVGVLRLHLRACVFGYPGIEVLPLSGFLFRVGAVLGLAVGAQPLFPLLCRRPLPLLGAADGFLRFGDDGLDPCQGGV